MNRVRNNVCLEVVTGLPTNVSKYTDSYCFALQLSVKILTKIATLILDGHLSGVITKRMVTMCVLVAPQCVDCASKVTVIFELKRYTLTV